MSSGFLRCVVLAASIRAIALMMEAASSSETSVNFYQSTQLNNPEDSRLKTRRRENLKSYLLAGSVRLELRNVLFHMVAKSEIEKLFLSLTHCKIKICHSN
jgi:hypothetical protein